jgi:hypothetical protein
MSAKFATVTNAQAVQIASPNRRRQWLVLATLSMVMLLVIGTTAMTIPIFFTPLIKHYGWSHARVSTLPTVYVLMLAARGESRCWTDR